MGSSLCSQSALGLLVEDSTISEPIDYHLTKNLPPVTTANVLGLLV